MRVVDCVRVCGSDRGCVRVCVIVGACDSVCVIQGVWESVCDRGLYSQHALLACSIRIVTVP